MGGTVPPRPVAVWLLLVACSSPSETTRFELSPTLSRTLAEPQASAGGSFEVVVPDAAAGPAGLVVWISASGSGAPPRGWIPVLRRHQFIWVGANDSGNDRPAPTRISLARLARLAAAETYDVDEARTLVAGFSGGARCASEAMLGSPTLFRAAIYLGAADHFRPVPSSDPRWRWWPPAFEAPDEARLQVARSRALVFVTGPRDPNHRLVLDQHAAYALDGFTRAILIEVPELGHRLPPAEVFEAALVRSGLAR